MTAHRTGVLLVAGLLLLGAVLRLSLWWVSPPSNAFDDHLAPIGYYATHASRPAPDACWQCYQPPLYYAVSALVLKVVASASDSFERAWRSVQLSSVLFSLLHLAIGWRILTLLGPIGQTPRLCAFAVLVFLPREMYGSVFVSNDAALVLASSAATLAYVEALRAGPSGAMTRHHLVLLLAVAAAAWTKQHGLILAILPVSLLLWERRVLLQAGKSEDWRGRRLGRGAMLAGGLLLIGGEEIYKAFLTGHLLVSNQHYFDWPKVQRPGSLAATSFFDLRLAALTAHPLLSPETVDSYWTQLFARLWFDYEPKFLTETATSSWVATASYGVGLLLGLAWGAGFVLAFRAWRTRYERLVLLVVQLAFLAVPAVQTFRFPYYSSMKATFFIPAVSISVVLVSLAFERAARASAGRVAVVGVATALALVACAQVVVMSQDIPNALLASFHGSKLWRLPAEWR